MKTHWNPVQIREVEIASLRSFMEDYAHLLTGRVLDFGAGKPGTCANPQPYRDLVKGEYFAMDIGDNWPNPERLLRDCFDSVICTQVVQYISDVPKLLRHLYIRLKPGRPLVMTFPTNWDEVEETDLWRFTCAGMSRLLRDAGFKHVAFHERGLIEGTQFRLGYGVIAWKPA